MIKLFFIFIFIQTVITQVVFAKEAPINLPIKTPIPTPTQTITAETTPSKGWWDCSKQPFKTVQVNSQKQLLHALDHAQAGTEILIDDGQYHFEKSLTISLNGNKCQPIIIKAKNLGKVIISRGDIAIKNSSWLTLEGISIKTVSDKKNPPIFIIDSEYVRISRVDFKITNNEQSKWLHVKASSNIRIDHSNFQNLTGAGNYIYVKNPSKNIHIDHNYFHGRNNIGGNGGESVYLHGMHGHRWDMHAIIEYNLFENLDAEWEMIGIKSHQNIVRFNTFIDNEGTVSIRGADYNKVYNNYFLNYSAKPTAAVRIHGYYNKVINNYSYGLTSNFVETYWGDKDISYISSEQRLTWWNNHNNQDSYVIHEAAYRKSSKNTIAFNTVVDSEAMFYWHKKCLQDYNTIPLKKRAYIDKNKEYVVFPPEDWMIANNLIINSRHLVKERFVKRGDMPCTSAKPIHEKQFTWLGNVATDDNSVNKVDNIRVFSAKEWQRKNIERKLTDTRGVYQIKTLIPANEFTPELGEHETDTEIYKQLKEHKYVGAQLNRSPLSPLDVGPLSP